MAKRKITATLETIFIESFAFFEHGSCDYTAVYYIFNITPDNLGKEIYQAGFDYYMPDAGFIFSAHLL